MSEDRITEALQAVRRADLGVETSGETEIRTLLRFRRQRRRRRVQRLAWAGAIAMALVIAMLYRPAPEVRHVAIAVPAAPEPAPIKVPVVTPVNLLAQREPQEVVTPFFPLMASAPPLESALLVRVTVTAAAMRSVGFEVSPEHFSDPVLADVLVGQDDLARAIRFVSYR